MIYGSRGRRLELRMIFFCLRDDGLHQEEAGFVQGSFLASEVVPSSFLTQLRKEALWKAPVKADFAVAGQREAQNWVFGLL